MLASLQETLPPDLDHEVIFVDDGSADGTREWLASLSASPRLRIILNPENLGYAGANNRGAEIATGDVLALLNNDLVLRPGWLEPMLAVRRRLGERAGLIGNVQRTIATGAIDHVGIFINLKGKPEHDRERPLLQALRGRSAYRRVAAVTGACVVIDRSVFRELGGFATRFVNGGEDVDLAFRLAQAGRINAVALRSVVGHHVSPSPNRKLRDEQNSYRLAVAWRDTLARHAARLWCWDYLRREWTATREPERSFTTAGLLAYALHLRPSPPPTALAGMQEAIDAELTRWRRLLPNEAV